MNSSGKTRKIPTGKLYYSISEVAEIAGVEQHVLRYWESEFPRLKPKKNRAGNRQYREKDIKIIRYIKHLLHNDMYTIQGAKKKLMESGYKEVEGQLDLLASIPDKKLRSKDGTSLTPLRRSADGNIKEKESGTDEKPSHSDFTAAGSRVLSEVKKELEKVLKLLQ